MGKIATALAQTPDATCPKCGPITPTLFRSRLSCPTCFRPVFQRPEVPVAPQVASEPPQPAQLTPYISTQNPTGSTHFTAVSPQATAENYATYVASDLTLIELPRETTGHPVSVYIGARAFWKLTVPVYVRLAQATARRLTVAQTPTSSPARWKGMAKAGASSATGKEASKMARPAPISPEDAEWIKVQLACVCNALMEAVPDAYEQINAMTAAATVPEMPPLPRMIDAAW
jgi:hypothetical protein